MGDLLEGTREATKAYTKRAAEYTKEEQDAVVEAYVNAYRERMSTDGASFQVLLQRISTTDDPTQLLHARFKLLEAYLNANNEEQAAMRSAYLETWRQLDAPAENLRSHNAYARYFTFLQLMPDFYPHEADALPILEDRCVESGLFDGRRHMLSALLGGKFELGPLTAAKAEEIYYALQVPDDQFKPGSESLAIQESAVYGLLGKCGESGMEVLRRMGVLNTPRGLEALSTMHTPEAEELLWEMAEFPENHPLTVLKALNLLYRFQYKDPQPDRLRRFREPVCTILTASEPGLKPNLKVLERAVQLAVKTGDAHYHGYIVRMERDLDPAALEQAEIENAGGLDRERHPQQYTSESLLDAIYTAKNALR